MSELFGVALVAAVALGLAWFVQHQRRRAWQVAAEQLGLRYVLRGRLFKTAVLEGTTPEGYAVTIDTVHRGTDKQRQAYTRFVVDSGGRIDAGLEVAREGMLGRFARSLIGREDVQCGDPELDRAALLRGDRAHLLGLLPADQRAHLSRLLEGFDLSVGSGQVRLELPEKTDAVVVVQRAEAALELARLLTHPDPATLPARLADLCLTDPLGSVRVAAWEELVSRWPGGAETARVRGARIPAIMATLPSAGPGQLSLVDAEDVEGRLSTLEGPLGELSEVEA